MIRMINVHKFYQELHVLKGINLKVKRQEVVVIMGASDSGISTLLRCLHDLERPEQGEIRMENRKLTEARGEIGAVFHHINLFPHKTVMENITETLTVIQKQTKEAAIQEGSALLEKVGLLDEAYVYPQKLSYGQKRRVALAQALALDPKLLLFDNPTVGIDESSAAQIIQIIKELISTGMTMIIGTNKMEVARELADRVVFLENGVIVEEVR